MGSGIDWLWGVTWQQVTLGLALGLALCLAIYQWWTARTETGEQAEHEREVEKRLRAIEEASDGVLLLGRADRLEYMNAAGARLFGYSTPDQLFGKSWRTLFATHEARRVETEVLPTFRREGFWVGEVTGTRRDGETLPVELSVSSSNGGGMTWLVRDGSWRADSLGEVRRELDRYRSIIETAGSALFFITLDGKLSECNGAAEQLFGRLRTQVIGRDFLHTVIPEPLRSQVAKAIAEVNKAEDRCAFETPLMGDEDRLVQWTFTYVDEGPGEAAGHVAVAQETTRLLRTQRALDERDDLYKLLATNSSDLIALHDRDGKYLYASPSSTSLLGMAPEELVGRDPYQLSHSDDWKKIQSLLDAAQAGRQHRTSFRMRTSSGEFLWFETLIRPIRDQSGQVLRLQSTSRDVSERKAFEDQLEHQALHEPLTGLPNRSLFMDRLRQSIVRSKRERGTVAVMFMDLDRFKIINDSMGHAVGDRLIAAVAERIRDCVREADTVARLGGDEFGVLLEFNITEQDVTVVAERILEELKPPFTFSGTEVHVTSSIGIAFSSPEGESPEDLLRYADVAMYRAKREGAGKYLVFDPDVDHRATRRLEMETGLRRALEREELSVMYQPLISLYSGRIYGFEALVRWEHPERGLVGPDEFIPIAEETGLIVPLGYYVMRRSCEQLGMWKQESGRDTMVVSVNLSTRQFQQPDLMEEIARILQETGTDPESLMLEITESELMQSAARISELKELGVRVAIDDFGTGYSSLSYLKNMQADSLKIDKSFVGGLGQNREDTAIVQTVITMAAALELDVTAEGVETEDQLTRLRKMGCHTGQGYFFAKPGTTEQARDLVKRDPRW